jgi:hypothetical protein
MNIQSVAFVRAYTPHGRYNPLDDPTIQGNRDLGYNPGIRRVCADLSVLFDL